MKIRSKLISFVEPNVLCCNEAEGELGSLVTDAEDVEDLRPLPRLRPVPKNTRYRHQLLRYSRYYGSYLRRSIFDLMAQLCSERLDSTLNYLQEATVEKKKTIIFSA